MMRPGMASSFLMVLVTLILVPSLVAAQYPVAVLTISPTELQLGGSVSLEWTCPYQSESWQYLPLPFIYAQITVLRVQEYPKSIAPYVSPYLYGTGTFSYTPPTNGTFSAILRCHYLGTNIGLGDFSCYSVMCKTGGQFVVTPSTTDAAT